jgi:tRNA (cytidine/uridine-2'-O-)-methyltransferase
VHKLQKVELPLKIALYQPDIAGNTGTILRLSACFGVPCAIIEPCGFPFSDKGLRRAGMDYAEHVAIERHADWASFDSSITEQGGRIALLTSKGDTSIYDAGFLPGDTLLLGSESAGAPDAVHARADLRLKIPMQPQFRSLNVAVAAGIALAEALRQTDLLPKDIS